MADVRDHHHKPHGCTTTEGGACDSPRHTIHPMTVELKATIRQRPPDHRGGYEMETAEISAEGHSYEHAKQLLEEQVPEDWQMLRIGRY